MPLCIDKIASPLMEMLWNKTFYRHFTDGLGGFIVFHFTQI